MTLDLGLIEALRLRYSYERLQWLMTAISGLAILTFSAQELWAQTGVGLCYQVNLHAFYLYTILFVFTIFYANVKDFQKILERTINVVSCALVSMILDLSLLSLSEFLILSIINQIAPDLLRSFISIFIIVLPLSLGELTLSSLTIEYLRKRADRLRTEIARLKNQFSGLEKQREEGEKKLRELEKKRAELQELFKSGERDE